MRYAEVNEGIITGVYVCDDDRFVKEMGWVGPVDELDPEPGVGWRYDGKEFSPPEEVEP